jgi:hypothetical protein
MLEQAVNWIQDNEWLLALLGGIGLLMFLGSLVVVPVIVALMPPDYFTRPPSGLPRRPLRQLGHVLKNLLGAVLVAAGLLMLVLPGQGILTLAIGISLIDFPGKQRLQLRLVRLRGVRLSIQWIRHKARRAPLQLDPPHKGPDN